MSSNFAAARIRLLRGAILRACLAVWPRSAFRSMIGYLASDFEMEEEALDRELSYIAERGWVEISNIPKSVLGRPEKRIRLTSTGYDVANRIDPKNPLMPEDAV